MKDIYDEQMRIYKSLRAELNSDAELTDQEKDWMLNNLQFQFTHNNQLIELELA